MQLCQENCEAFVTQQGIGLTASKKIGKSADDLWLYSPNMPDGALLKRRTLSSLATHTSTFGMADVSLAR